MKIRILALFCLLWVNAFSQISDDPVTVPVRVSLEFATPVPQNNQPGAASILLAGQGYSYSLLPSGFVSTSGNPNFVSQLAPGKNYSLSMSALWISTYYRVALAIPKGYRLYINDVEQLGVSYGPAYIPNMGTMVKVPGTVTVRVESTQPTPVAESTPLRPGRLVWGVGLGKLKNGAPAGMLQMRQNDMGGFTAGDFQMASLYWASASAELKQYTSNVNSTYQIFANECLVQVEALTGGEQGFRIKFYSRNQVTSTLGSDNLWVVNSSPAVEYKLQNTTPNAYTESAALLVTKINRINSAGHSTARTTYSQISRITGAPAGTLQWKVVDWTTNVPNGSLIVSPGESWTRWTYSNSGLNEEIEVFDSGTTKASDVMNTYTQYNWGSELTQKVEGYGGSNPQTTQYVYNNGGWWGNNTQLQYQVNPDGSWQRFDYYSDAPRLGLLASMWQPFGDTGSGPIAADYQNGMSVSYDYAVDHSGFRKTRTSSVITTIGGVVTGKVLTTYVDGTVTENAYTTAGTTVSVAHPIVTATAQTFTGAGTSLTSTSECYREDAGMLPVTTGGPYEATRGFLPTLPLRGRSPAGVLTKYTYTKGERDPYFWGFVPVAGGSEWLVTKEVSADGTLVDGGSEQSCEVHGYDGSFVLGWNAIYNSGWQRTRAMRCLFNGFVLDGKEQSSGTSVFNFWTLESYIWDGGLIQSKTDQSGVTHDFTYKGIGWVESDSLRVPSGAPANIPANAITTKFSYDGAGRVTQKRLQASASAGADDSVTNTVYDTAGRMTSESKTGPNGMVTTNYAYNVGGNPRAQSVTLPTTAVKQVTTYLDGRPKSETGTALWGGGLSRTVTYGVESGTGNLWTKELLPSGGYNYEVLDWAGRKIRSTATGYGGVRTATVNEYDAASGYLLKSRTVAADASDNASFASTALTPSTLYAYDSLGRVFQECLDVDNDGTISTTGTSLDRITQYGYSIQTVNSDFVSKNPGFAFPGGTTVPVVWQQKTTAVYTYICDANGAYISSSITPKITSYDLSALNSYAVLGAGSVKTLVGERKSRNVRYDGTLATEALSTTSTLALSTPSLAKIETKSYVPTATNVGTSISVNGFKYTETGIDGVTATTSYDSYGRVAGVYGRESMQETYTYYPGTSLVKNVRNAVLNPGNIGSEWQTNTYDNFGRLILHQVNDTGTLVKTYSDYDIRGNVLHNWGNGTNPVQYDYDNLNRRTYTRLYRDENNTVNWNSATWPGATATADVTAWGYDGPTGLLISKSYPPAVQGDSAIPSNRTAIASTAASMTYDALNRIVTQSIGTLGGSQYTYYTTGSIDGALGELKSISALDGLSLPIPTPQPSPTPTPAYPKNYKQPTISYCYNRLGQYSKVEDGTGTRTFQYSDIDLQPVAERLSASFFGGKYIELVYDSKGRSTGYKLKDSSYIYQTIDSTFESNTGRIHDITASNEGAGPTARTFSYAYHANSNLIDSVSSGTAMVRSYAWETWRNIPDALTTTSGSKTVYRLQYDFDWMGRVLGEANIGDLPKDVDSAAVNGFRKHYLYTPRGELDTTNAYLMNSAGADTTTKLATGAVSAEHNWDYDNLGNRVKDVSDGITTAFLANALNQTTRISSGSAYGVYWYNEDGNLTNDGTWRYIWDTGNRLIQMEEIAGTAKKLVFQYDYLGRRVQKQLSVGGVVSFDRRFIWVGNNLIAEYNAQTTGTGPTPTPTPTPTTVSNTMVSLYVWGLDVAGGGAGGVGGLLMQVVGTASGNLQKDLMPLYDFNGTIHGYMDPNGAILTKMDMTPFGEIRVSGGSHSGNTPFGFASKYVDSETGLVQYNNRYYSPKLGKFISRDLIGERGGLNLYGYCGNDPINHWDLLGNSWFGDLFSGIAGFFGSIFNAVADVVKSAAKWVAKNWTSIVGTVLSVICPPLGFAFSAAIGYYYGGVSGMLMGFAVSIVGQGIGGGICKFLGDSIKFASGALTSAVKGAIIGTVSGGINAAISGGNVWQGMLAGAISGAVTGALSYQVQQKFGGKTFKPLGEKVMQRMTKWMGNISDKIANATNGLLSGIRDGIKDAWASVHAPVAMAIGGNLLLDELSKIDGEVRLPSKDQQEQNEAVRKAFQERDSKSDEIHAANEDLQKRTIKIDTRLRDYRDANGNVVWGYVVPSANDNIIYINPMNYFNVEYWACTPGGVFFNYGLADVIYHEDLHFRYYDSGKVDNHDASLPGVHHDVEALWKSTSALLINNK